MGAVEAVGIGVLLAMVIVIGTLITLGASAAARARRELAPTVADLRLRIAALPGRPGRRPAVLQLRLRDAVEHTRRVLLAADPAVRNTFADLTAELIGEARQLDAQIRLVEREPQPDLRANRLDTLAPHIERLISDLGKLREVVYGLVADVHEPGRTALEAERGQRLDGLLAAVRELRNSGVSAPPVGGETPESRWPLSGRRPAR